MTAPVYEDPLVRPTFDAAVAALLVADSRFSWAQPTPDEVDAAVALRHIAATHRGSARDCDNPDEARHCNRTWGTCTTCDEPWPCAVWSDGHSLAVEYLGRAHNRYLEHSRGVFRRLAKQRKEAA